MTKNNCNVYDSAEYAHHFACEKNYRQQVKNLFGGQTVPSRLTQRQKLQAAEALGYDWHTSYRHHRQQRIEHAQSLKQLQHITSSIPTQKATYYSPQIWQSLKYIMLSFGLLWAKPAQAPQPTKTNYAQLTTAGALPLTLIIPGGYKEKIHVPLDGFSCNGLKLLEAQLNMGYKLDSTQLKQPLIAEGDTLTIGAYLDERRQHEKLMNNLNKPIHTSITQNIKLLPKVVEPDSTYAALLTQQQVWRNMAQNPYGASQKAAMQQWHRDIEKLPPKQRIVEQKKMQLEMARLEQAQAVYESKAYQKKLFTEKQKLQQAINQWQMAKKNIKINNTPINNSINNMDTMPILTISSIIPDTTIQENKVAIVAPITTDSTTTTHTVTDISPTLSELDTNLLLEVPVAVTSKPAAGMLAFTGITPQGQTDLLVQPRARFNLGENWQIRLDGVLRHVPTFNPVADSLRQFTVNLQSMAVQYTHLKQQGNKWLKNTLMLGPHMQFLSNPAPNMTLLDNTATCTCTSGGDDLPHKNNQLTEYGEHYITSAQTYYRTDNSQASSGLALGVNTPLQWRNKNQPAAPNVKPTWLAHASYQHHFDNFNVQGRVAANNNGWGLWAQAQDAIGRWDITFQKLNVQNLFQNNWVRKQMTSIMLSTQTKFFDASLTFQQQKLDLLNDQTQQDKTLKLTTGWPLDKNKQWALTTENWWHQNQPSQHSVGLKAKF